MVKRLSLTENTGLSLVELVIVIALLGTVLALGYSFFFFGNRTFAVGESQSITQQGVRLAAGYISNEVRYANQLEILAFEPESFEENYYYLYLSEEEGQIKYRRPEDIDASTIHGGIFSDLDFDLVFERGIMNVELVIGEHTEEESSVLSFTITGENDREKSYTLVSDVIILNLVIIDGSEDGKAVRFTIPDN